MIKNFALTFTIFSTFMSVPVFAADNLQPDVRYATGKTTFIAEDCAKKAEGALLSVGAKNVSTKIDLVNWVENNKATKYSSRSSWGLYKKTYLSIQCRPFEYDIVVFVTSGNNAEKIKELWDAFYK